jgi:uncharacterized protein (DUF1499 family)
MKRVLRAVFLAAAALALAASIGGCMGLFSGSRPDNLGVENGRLAPCKPTPNCVSSFADAGTDPGHFVEQLRFKGDPDAAFAKLGDVVRGRERVTIVRDEPRYLYAEFRSKLMGYVDDVEFLLDPTAKVIHVRSASRLGRSDFGVNRGRVESLRSGFAAANP